MRNCFFINGLHVAVVYIHVPGDPTHVGYAKRFVISYLEKPTRYPHDLVIVCNGSPPTAQTHELFAGVQPVRFVQHDDSGWDIGGYQKAAREVECDLMVFFGGAAYVPRSGWLERMVEAYLKHGPALYGAMGNRGDSRVNVYPHIRTTGFWLPRDLFNAYPIQVTRNEQRYEFEHGKTCLTEWIKAQGLKPWVVSWDGEYEWAEWDSFPNGFHRGDQSALLVRDRVSDPPYYHC